MIDTDKAIKLIRELGSMGLLACVLYFTYMNDAKTDAQFELLEAKLSQVKEEGRERAAIVKDNATVAVDIKKSMIVHKHTNGEFMAVRDPDGRDVKIMIEKE